VNDFKSLVELMANGIERYGLWRIAAIFALAITLWRLPEIITAVRWW